MRPLKNPFTQKSTLLGLPRDMGTIVDYINELEKRIEKLEKKLAA